MCGVVFRGNSAGQIFSRNSSGVFLRPKSSAFFTTGLLGKDSSICFRATGNCGIALKANNIGNSRAFSTACSKKLSYLIENKSSSGNLNMRREDGSVAHSLFHRSEKRQSTLAACSASADEASRSTSSSKSFTNAKADTVKRKSSRGSKKEVDGDMKEKKVLAQKKRTSARTRKAATKTTESNSVNQEDKKADNSKSKRGADSSKEKKVNNRSKSKTKVSAASTVSSEAQICTKTSNGGSHSEAKPLAPLFPPTAKSVVVVESATKAKVIQNYLGDMYEVVPSYCHVRDLAGRSKSVRPDDDFSMVWEVPSAAWTHLKSIKVALKGYVS
jgi:hypothetical protein